MSKTRAWEGGASVFTSFLFPKAAAPAKRAIQQAGKKEGVGGEGIFARLLRKRSPAAPPENLKGGTEQKNFLFLLKEKIGRAQNKKLRRKLFCGTASEASGGGAERQSSQSGFSSKKVRILTKRYRQFSEISFVRPWRGGKVY